MYPTSPESCVRPGKLIFDEQLGSSMGQRLSEAQLTEAVTPYPTRWTTKISLRLYSWGKRDQIRLESYVSPGKLTFDERCVVHRVTRLGGPCPTWAAVSAGRTMDCKTFNVHKLTYPDAYKFQALSGTNLVMLPPGFWPRGPPRRGVGAAWGRGSVRPSSRKR